MEYDIAKKTQTAGERGYYLYFNLSIVFRTRYRTTALRE